MGLYLSSVAFRRVPPVVRLKKKSHLLLTSLASVFSIVFLGALIPVEYGFVSFWFCFFSYPLDETGRLEVALWEMSFIQGSGKVISAGE